MHVMPEVTDIAAGDEDFLCREEELEVLCNIVNLIDEVVVIYESGDCPDEEGDMAYDGSDCDHGYYRL